ncbi:MAG: endolytic transglycosylase MltG [Acidimicrobiia bacterium]
MTPPPEGPERSPRDPRVARGGGPGTTGVWEPGTEPPGDVPPTAPGATGGPASAPSGDDGRPGRPGKGEAGADRGGVLGVEARGGALDGDPVSFDEGDDDLAYPDEDPDLGAHDDPYGYDDATYGDEDPGVYEDPYGYDDDGYDYEDLRPESSVGRRVAVVLVALVVVMALVVGAAWTWYQRQVDPPGPPGDEVVLTVPEGSTSDQIGALLADHDVIASEMVWGWYLRLNGGGPFQAGDYTFRENSSMGDAVSVLEAGPAPPEVRRFTIPEGLTLREVLDRLASADQGLGFDRTVLQQVVDAGQIRSRYQPAEVTSAEGILFPDTYDVGEDADPATVLAMLAGQLDSTMAELQVEAKAAALGRSPYEILVIASLIEEESRVPAERPRIAQVIYNRLERGIPLGIDATSRYEAELAGRSRDDLDFTSDSPYNTRRVAGIPPTPIAAPGRASIEAALDPEAGPWIYYVLADEAGNHFFTDSSREFERAKSECKAKGLGCG